jgi:hypothetical protein
MPAVAVGFAQKSESTEAVLPQTARLPSKARGLPLRRYRTNPCLSTGAGLSMATLRRSVVPLAPSSRRGLLVELARGLAQPFRRSDRRPRSRRQRGSIASAPRAVREAAHLVDAREVEFLGRARANRGRECMRRQVQLFHLHDPWKRHGCGARARLDHTHVVE